MNLLKRLFVFKARHSRREKKFSRADNLIPVVQAIDCLSDLLNSKVQIESGGSIMDGGTSKYERCWEEHEQAIIKLKILDLIDRL